MTGTSLRFRGTDLKLWSAGDIEPAEMMDFRTNPLEQRIRSEFLEMPGLRLTTAQAARLWAVDRETSERILNGLTAGGFLFKTKNGAYLRATAA